MRPTTDKPKSPKRRWLSFSLRGLFLFAVIIAVGIALPMRWHQDDIAQYEVEQEVIAQIESANGWTYGKRWPLRQQSTWAEYPGHLWKQVMNWGHDADLYDDISGVVLPTEKLERLTPQLKKLRSLRSISFSPINSDDFGLPLSDEDIAHIAAIDTLEDLDLASVTVTPDQLRRLSALPKLQVLELPLTGKTTPFLNELSRFPVLEHLSVDDVPVDESCMKALQSIHNLKYLDLEVSKVLPTSDGIAVLSSLGNLETLRLNVPSLDDRWFQAVGSLTSLKLLSIRGSVDTGKAPGFDFTQLSNLSKLESLTVDGVCIDDQALETIGKMTSLTELKCDASLTTDAGMKNLAGLANLTEANLSGTQITIHGLHELSKAPMLDYVHLGAGFHVSLRDHRGHFCGTCAMPFDYASKTQFGEANAAWYRSITITESDSSQDPFASTEYSSEVDPFAPTTELPNNFADTINDPFLPPSEELASE